MDNLPAGEPRGDGDDVDRHGAAAGASEAGALAAGMIARARWLLIISGVTTMIAIAAVVAVIGYRVFRGSGSGAAPRAEGIITLPKGARVVASTVADERLVVTLEIAGTSEVRIFDLKTLQQIGRLRFAIER